MRNRIELLDLWRSLCLLVMVLFHLCYDLMLFDAIPAAVMASPAARLVAYDVGGCFIFISGICLRFSRDPVRRGFFVFCAGAAVTVVTWLLHLPVAFGILQLIGVCMMLCGALRERLEPHLNGRFPLVCLLLFGIAWALTAELSVETPYLYPLGLHGADFFSADYWPLLPWGFLFLLGVWFGKRIAACRTAPLFSRHFPPWLTWPGRHSLWVYLLHQPVLYGVCYLLFS